MTRGARAGHTAVMQTRGAGGATIHYTTTGSGPAVLLLQGVGAIGGAWRPQIEALAVDHTAIAVDNRGIGNSSLGSAPLSIETMAADALAVADAVGATSFDVVGHSMGGIIAQQLALTAPARVRSLSLLCTFARGAQGARLSWDLLVAGLRSRIGPRAVRRRAFVELVMPAEYLARVDRAALDLELSDLFGRDLADQPPIVMAQLKAMGRYDAFDRLAASRVNPDAGCQREPRPDCPPGIRAAARKRDSRRRAMSRSQAPATPCQSMTPIGSMAC